jgi:hypothetical protein
MHRFASPLRATLVALVLVPAPLLAQGRIIASFPYSQPFAFVPSGSSTTPNGPIGEPVFPSGDVDGGELTVDANTSSLLVSGSATGLNNNLGAGGILRIQTSGSTTPTISQGFIVHVSFTGKIAGSISLDWAKIANGSSTRASELRIAASADGGAFSDLVSAGFDNSSTAQAGTLTATLPSTLNGVDSVRFHIYSINVSGSGSHPRVLVDNLAITATDESPLPVELAGFSATRRDASVELAWRTASEVNNDGFEILRADASDSLFAAIASFRTEPSLVGLGTSPTGRSYRFVDELPPSLLASGATLLYQLADVSSDGTRTLRALRTVRIDPLPAEPEPPELEVLRLQQVAPVPANDHIAVVWSQPEPGPTSIELLDRSGARAERIEASGAAGTNRIAIDVRSIASGTYTLVVRRARSVRSQPFVVVH